jgi:mRNA interferase HigB
MNIITPKTLKVFYTKYPDSQTPLLFWTKKIKDKNYETPQEIIADFKKSDYVRNQRIGFNIAKNKYRLIVAFDFYRKAAFIKFIRTHKEYDKVGAKTVEFYKK